MIIETVLVGLLGLAFWFALSKLRTRTTSSPQPSSKPCARSPRPSVNSPHPRTDSIPRLGSIRIRGNPGEPDVTQIWRRSNMSDAGGERKPSLPRLEGEVADFPDPVEERLLPDGCIERWFRHEQVPGLDAYELSFGRDGGGDDLQSQKGQELVHRFLPEMIEDLEQELSEERMRDLSRDVKHTLVQKSVQDLTNRLFQRLEEELGEKLPDSTMLDFEIELRDDLAQALAGM